MRRLVRLLFLPMMALALVTGHLQAQDAGKYKNFPVPFGPTNVGRDFWFSFPANWDVPTATQYYIRLYITSGVETRVRIYVGGAFMKQITTKPYDVVTYDFTPVQAQVFTRRDVDPVPPDQVYKNKAIHVEADDPIVVYGMNRTSYTSDGVLVLPTNGLGRQYVVASYAAVADGSIQELPSQYMIVAPYDGTTISIKQTSRTESHPEGDAFTINMDRGDVWSSMTRGYNGDQTGVTIYASKPVYVVGGQNCTYIPNLITYCCCDHLCETMLPVEAWGNFYHAVPFIGRRNGDFYRVFAAEDNTTIYVNGAQHAILSSRGGLEGIGWLEYRAVGRDLIEFAADKPIYVAQYNTSQAYDGVPSDPFYLVMTPVEQYQTGVTFSTPAADFPLNYINLVCDSSAWYQMEIAQGGTENWTKLRSYSGSTNPIKFYPSKINGLKWMGTTILVQPGTYRIRSPRPFAGYLYGFSAYDSYGYPLSVAVGNRQTPDTVAPEIVKTQNCNGTVTATTTDLPEDGTIRSNLSTIELDRAHSVNYMLTVDRVPPLEPGISVSQKYTLSVIDPTQDAIGIYTISDAAGNETTDTVTYTTFNVQIRPTPLDFGTLIRGDITTQTVRITNKANRSIDIREVRLQNGGVGFKILSPTGGFILNPGDSIDAAIEFTATIGGTFKDSIGVRDTCGLRYLSEVRAHVVSPVIEVTDKDFGAIVVGASVDGQIEIRNKSTDGGRLTIYGGTGPFGTPVIFTTPDGLPQPTPFDIAAGDARPLRVSFGPLAVTSYIDSIVFNHNAPPNPENDSVGILRGRGIQASLIATSYDWGRRRIFTGPHPSSVYLKNFGTAPVRVTGLAGGGPTGDVGDFTYDFTNVIGRTLGPGDSVAVPVTFTPSTTGPRSSQVEYSIEPPQSEPVISKLDGIGIQPALTTEDHDFGTMNVNERDELRDVYFWIPTTAWPDSVTITGFAFVSDQGPGGIADYTRLPLDQPITLIPGRVDTVKFTGTFRARAAGTRTATLTALTTDPLDQSVSKTVSNWTGQGVSLSADISGRPDSAMGLCLNTTQDLVVTVTNGGQAPLTVNSLALKGTGEFQLIGPGTPFALGAGQSQGITVRFAPTRNGVQFDTVVVDNTTATAPVLEIPIVGSARGGAIRGHIVLTGTTEDGRGRMGEEVTARIVIDDLPPGLNLSDYTFFFNYDDDLLRPLTDKIALKSGVNPTGGVATIDAAQTIPGLLVVNVDNSDTLTGPGDLVEVPFYVLFDDLPSRVIKGGVSLSNGQCLTVDIIDDTISIEPICGLHLRLIELTSQDYTLDQNKPNPFNPITVIRYSLGLDGPTKMVLYNEQGKVVQTLVDEYQQPGVYELTVDVTALPSGLYYYTLVSGDWTETRSMTVVK